MSSGLCPCGWIHTKGSEWRCAKYLEHQHAITENKNDIPNNPNNKNGKAPRGHDDHVLGVMQLPPWCASRPPNAGA
jgi:hypothetical protein